MEPSSPLALEALQIASSRSSIAVWSPAMLVKKGQHSKIPLVAVKCQYTCNLGLEDEHKCLRELSGEEWRYCEKHRELGPEQYKALTTQTLKRTQTVWVLLLLD
jgi:hypothetical protein